jgi:nucleotide-binding universal stress UspA family protein
MITEPTLAPDRQSTVDTTILVAYDGSRGSRCALAWALAEGARRRRPLKLVYVLDPACPLPPVSNRWPHHDRRTEADLRLARVAAEANNWGRAGLEITTDVWEGAPTNVLRDLSDSAGMIVVGERGHGGFRGLQIGSVALQLATHARSSVVVVRGPLRLPDQRPVVAGLDGPHHDEVVAAGLAEAALRGVGLVALRSIGSTADTAEATGWIREAIQPWRPRFPDVVVTDSVVTTAPTHALLLASHDAQLVVVGARGSGGFEDLPLGSTTEGILHHGLCSVMVVR